MLEVKAAATKGLGRTHNKRKAEEEKAQPHLPSLSERTRQLGAGGVCVT